MATVPTQAMRKSRRRESDDATDQYRTGRKRAQNRVSQQCARERKRLAEQRKVTAIAPGSESGRQHAYLELVEENEQLKEALLSTRKKLLSLSTAAATAADHPIFQRILALTTGQAETATEEDDAHEDRRHVRPTPAQVAAIPQVVPPLPSPQSVPQDVHQQAGLTGVDVPPAHSPDLCSSAIVSLPVGQHAPFQTLGPGLDGASMGKDWGVDMLLNGGIDFTGFDHVFDATEWPMASCPNDVVERLEETMLLYLAHRFGMQDISRTVGQTSAEVTTQVRLIKSTLANANFPQLHPVLDEAATACIELMTSYASVTSYIFGTGAHISMEHIMRWRLAPSSANRACIPAPFCPTPLQYTMTDHPIVIDFVNWPTIRDQLILHRGEYDLDAMIGDMVHGTVIDVPSVGYSFNIRDLFMTRVEGSPDMPNTPATNGDERTASPQSRGELVSHVIAAMREQSAKSAAQPGRPWELGATDGPRAILPRTHALSQEYGLDDLSQWRLSAKFASKYPFLDCSEVTAVYPLRSALLSPLATSRPRFSTA